LSNRVAARFPIELTLVTESGAGRNAIKTGSLACHLWLREFAREDWHVDSREVRRRIQGGFVVLLKPFLNGQCDPLGCCWVLSWVGTWCVVLYWVFFSGLDFSVRELFTLLSSPEERSTLQ